MGTKVTTPTLGAVENSSFITDLNAGLDLCGDEFDKVLYRDGSFALTGNLDCSGKRLFNLPAPASPTDPLRLLDISSISGTPGTNGTNAVNPVFTVATGNAGTSVSLSGTYPNLLLTVPRGDPGTSGALGNGTYSGIVVTGGGTALDVVAGHITLTRMANLAANSIIGNNTGSAAVPVALSGSQVKTLIGLSAVDNTSDAGKPVSTATQTALNLKADSASVATPASVTAQIAADRAAATVNTIPIMAGSMLSRTTGGAATGTYETTTNKLNFLVLDFDDTATEYAQFAVPMPKSWDEGTVTAQFIWKSLAGTAAQSVVWAIQGVAISDDDVIDAAFGTAVSVTDALTATSDIMQSAFTAAVTIAGTPVNEDVVQFQVYRDAANGSDTLVSDARLIGVRLKFTTTARDDS